MTDRIYGLTEQQFKDAGAAVKAIQSGVRPTRTGGSVYPVGGMTLALAVCAITDWTAWGSVTVKVRNGATLTSTEIECVAPGTDGTDMAGTRGIIVLFAGENGPQYQFIPLECLPSCEIS